MISRNDGHDDDDEDDDDHDNVVTKHPIHLDFISSIEELSLGNNV